MQQIIPQGWEHWAAEFRYAPVVEHDGLLFVSGCTAAQPDGSLPQMPVAQMRAAFENVRKALSAAGAGFHDVVEMTTYHVGLQAQAETFAKVKIEAMGEHKPAWTAVGVSELIVPGAIVEIRIIARRHGQEDRNDIGNQSSGTLL